MAYDKKYQEIAKAWVTVAGEWDGTYERFREWSDKRWAEGAQLCKLYEELPWGIDNAEWVGGHDPDAWTIQWSRQYHRIPVPKSNPCKSCRSAGKCTKICPARARWWDAAMEKIRKEIGK